MSQASTSRVGYLVGLALLTGLLSILTAPSSAQAAPQGLSVTVSDDKNEVRSDSDTAYKATVRNDGTEPAKVTLVLTVPGYVTITDAPDADIADTNATWTVQIDPGKAITTTANTHIKDIPAGQFRVTTLASVYENDTNQSPLIRNADANRIQGVTDPADTRRNPAASSTNTSSSATWSTWLLIILLPIAAIAIIAGTIYLRRRHSNNQPPNHTADTSTPPNATTIPTNTEATR